MNVLILDLRLQCKLVFLLNQSVMYDTYFKPFSSHFEAFWDVQLVSVLDHLPFDIIIFVLGNKIKYSHIHIIC